MVTGTEMEVREHNAAVDELDCAGFCAGARGPVGAQNYLHGFTASIALFHQTAD